MGQPLNVGIVGCGTIVNAYLSTFRRLTSVKLVAAADLELSRAEAVADSYPGVRALPVDELMADQSVDLVLNLTVPAAHADIAAQAIAAGKSVYGEKPLASTTLEARERTGCGARAGVRVGCAPDTVLGTGIQTARRAVDDGLIGMPIAATATFGTPGHERWHHNPDFYYAAGWWTLVRYGPVLHQRVDHLARAGRVRRRRRQPRAKPAHHRLGSATRANHPRADRHPCQRCAGSCFRSAFDDFHELRHGRHASGALEIHGESGSLIAPDPNNFDGDVLVRTTAREDWQVLPVSAGYIGSSRGYGVHDLATSQPGEEPRAGGLLALHVLDVMESLLRSAHEGIAVTVHSRCERPAAVPLHTLA